jgi:sugar O-acyltransferase (sialic acid O-acetyltransferase NeuD family)
MIHLIGAGGHASVVVDVAKRLGATEITLWSESEPRPGRFPPLVIWKNVAELPERTPVVMALGDLARRAELRRKFPVVGDALVDPSAILGSGVRIGGGTVVMPGCIINANASIEEDAILNTGCTVEHDCVVGRNAHIAPSVSLGGAARVGAGSMVGTGAIVLPCITIGNGATIGAGAVVHQPVPDGVTVVGVPAREVSR